MSEIAAQFAIVIGVLVTCFMGPGIAYYFLLRRKRQARMQRKSPIGKDLLRGPGHSLREQLDEARSDVIFDLMQLSIMPLMVLALHLAWGHVRGLASLTHLAPVFIVAALTFIGFTVRKLVRTGARVDHLKAGFDAELAVGQELDQLMRQGAAVFHDLPADNFNIDHIVISSEGVFAVETKGFTKPKQGRGKADATVVFDGKVLRFPTWATKEPLEQAERQAAWLAKWLTSSVGSPIHVVPVVALPGWFVELTGRSNVRVFNGKQLTSLLKSRGAQPLSDINVQRVSHQVEQRCRTVAPRYAEEERAS